MKEHEAINVAEFISTIEEKLKCKFDYIEITWDAHYKYTDENGRPVQEIKPNIKLRVGSW